MVPVGTLAENGINGDVMERPRRQELCVCGRSKGQKKLTGRGQLQVRGLSADFFQFLSDLGMSWMVIAAIEAYDRRRNMLLSQLILYGLQMSTWKGDGESAVIGDAGDVCLSTQQDGHRLKCFVHTSGNNPMCSLGRHGPNVPDSAQRWRLRNPTRHDWRLLHR